MEAAHIPLLVLGIRFEGLLTTHSFYALGVFVLLEPRSLNTMKLLGTAKGPLRREHTGSPHCEG